ncbi:hypothetical protein PRZ48_013001 [Zasmidium cellare]|uniref:MIF4G domain-containing protein n=1 Tax=Zasmidium cellare TaxID=395010 RepID=A0ABR0E3P6_ZASCE|nr:hypothetical protein PRZ48_013001 [Zasmidium cellare]
MTSAVTASAAPPSLANSTSTPSSQSGALPAQRPVSSAPAFKTASPTTGAQAQHAKSASNQLNGGSAQPASNMNGHDRKSSVVISASGTSGNYPNGGPVLQNGGSRPAISFGSMNTSGAEPQGNAPFQHQNASLPAPSGDPRVTSPAHSPSPIPQPPASGGRPPSISGQNNGLAFGSLPADNDIMRGQVPQQPNMGALPMHERRPSSQSMQSEISNPGVNMARPPFNQQGAGRGRGYPNAQPQFMGSPGPGYRPIPGSQGRPNMPSQFQGQGGPPGSPFQRGARASPVPGNAQPHMPHMGGNQMHYPGYPQHLNPQTHVNHPFSSALQPKSRSESTSSSLRHVSSSSDKKDSSSDDDAPILCKKPSPALKFSIDNSDNVLTGVRLQQGMYGMPNFDPNAGYYQPYYYPPYGAQPPASPRPQYPSPFQGPPGPGMQAPFHPPGTPAAMARSSSQASERPPSSLGHPQTPAPNAPAPSHTPLSNQQAPSATSSSFVKPTRKSNAIKITDAQGNAINFNKSSPATTSQAQPQTPVIVSTPNAPTPPPRAPSTQHNRTESKTTKSSEETKNAFAEQVRKQAEESKRKEAEAKEKAEAGDKAKESAEQDAEVKKAAAEAEEAAAKAAADKKGEEDAAAAKKSEEDAAAAKKATEEDEAEKKRREDEELEREIAEMEAREKEEEEREKAFQEKRAKEKEAAKAKEGERAAKADEELKRQEREAEEREAAREREREAEAAAEKSKAEPDEEAKSLFAALKKPTLGPGASAPASGTETPTSEDTPAESNTDAESSAPAASRGAQKPKPAHLKLETNKPVERAEPTPGMQALKSARIIEVQDEVKYPEGFKSPNPALNQAASRKGRAYDKDFLLQFQKVFKEKPSVDWDQKVKETLGPSDEPGSARAPGSARTPSGMGPRQNSRGGAAMGNFGGAMGNFGGPMGPRTLPPGTTSQERFMASQMGGMPSARGGAPGMTRAPSNLGMGAPGSGMARTNSGLMMGGMGGPGSPRQPSARGGKGSSKRDGRAQSKREEAEMASKMPLTAHMEITPLEKSQSGWKPTSIGQPMNTGGPDPSGNMAPDLVQRKVKAALNKMTPEKFDKISDQILEIAAQSKNETDGRTLRQVIQLTFEKACDEAHWAGMYAKFCHKMLTTMSTEIRDETIKDKAGNPVVGGALFRKYLLNRCQEEFERGWQANLPDKPEGETQEAALLSDEYYVAAAAKRRGLGLIQFIGQLYKLRMLTLRIMHECVLRLLNFEGDPDEAAIENLTTLLKAVGATMDEDPQGKGLIDTYFQRIDDVILKSDALPSRPRFMIMDLIDLRKAGWRGKDDAKGPKTIQQIHAEAEAAAAKQEAERQRTQRGGPGGGRMPAGRGDARNFSGGMPPPVDYNKTTVGMDDLRRLQQRGATRATGSLGPGGGLGPSSLGPRAGSRRGAGNLGPSGSGNTTRTNTPPVDGKKDEPTQQNAFSALAALDPSGEQPEETPSEAASPPAARNRSKSPLAAEKDESNA